jgi:hypothetical protein
MRDVRPAIRRQVDRGAVLPFEPIGRASIGQPRTNRSPTALSRVALAACNDTAQV